ncbi:MAG: cytochrome b/b6 domain-containing protein [Gammaproteobacteria bacterium]|nr:cytochrome b/b6 domain-containing protein [Gammaproteobacteria bacterium]
MSTTAQRVPTVKVWDLLVRCLHWTLVASVALAWLTRHSEGGWHEKIGYVALSVVVIRLCWGFIGSRYARFGHFVRTPTATIAYARSLTTGTAPRYLGHNPLAGYMTIALLTLVALVCASGWMYTTETFWGVEWVEQLHEGLTNLLLGLVALHILGVIGTSRHTGENLAAAMVHGNKRAPGPGDVD